MNSSIFGTLSNPDFTLQAMIKAYLGLTKSFCMCLQRACHTCPKIDITPTFYTVSWYTEGSSQYHQQLHNIIFIGELDEIGLWRQPPGKERRIRYGPFGHWPYGRSTQAGFGRCWSISPSTSSGRAKGLAIATVILLNLCEAGSNCIILLSIPFNAFHSAKVVA